MTAEMVRPADIVRLVLLVHWRPREKVRLYCQRIAVADASEARIWEYREIIGPVGPHALAQRPQELCIGPAPNTGLGIRCNIGAVERPERRGERPTAREWLAAGRGVAGDAAARSHQILAVLDRIFLRRRGGRWCQRHQRHYRCEKLSPIRGHHSSLRNSL